VKTIGSGFGDVVDDGASVASVLRAVAVGDDLKLGDGVLNCQRGPSAEFQISGSHSSAESFALVGSFQLPHLSRHSSHCVTPSSQLSKSRSYKWETTWKRSDGRMIEAPEQKVIPARERVASPPADWSQKSPLRPALAM